MTFHEAVALLVAICFLVVVIALLRRIAVSAPLPYFTREYLLSRGEHVFYQTLRRSIPAHLMICPKVRMGDIINCSGDAWKKGFGARISQKHIDFMLVDSDTTAIALAIELDDRTHNQRRRQERDEFVDKAFAAAKVPMLRIPAAAAYDLRALRTQIATLIKDTSTVGAPGGE
jgi:hypothetical protein